MVSSSPPFEDKSYHHDEPLQLHSMPPWKRYESEEEEVSETSSVRAFTPTDPETESSNDSDAVVENGLPSPSREDSDDSESSLYSRPISVVTAKRNSTATYNAQHESSENESAREYVTPPVSPTSILPHTTTGEPDTSIVTGEDGEEAEEEEQIFEAKQILYTAPTSKPNIIVIHNLTSESILSSQAENDESNKNPENVRKRSSTASGLSPPDRSKRYSSMFLRDDGELAYADPRNHVRARSAQRVGGSPYRSRAASPSVNGETRPQLLRRNTSQRSTRSVYIAAPDETLRTRTFRSASLASDNTSSSSRSSKQPFTQNSSTSSLHTSSTSSTEFDSEKSKLTPHPLSISTTVLPAPVQFTGPFGTSPRNPGLAPHMRSESLLEVDPISPAASTAYSPMEQTDSRMSMLKAQQGIYSLRHNPTLSLNTDLDPAHQQVRQQSRDWAFVSSPASAKTPKAGASAMKSLMGGFRGLGRPRKRSLVPAPAPN